MPLNDWIAVETTTTPAPPPPPDTPRTFAMVAEAVPAAFTERFRLYSSIGELDDDGWTGSESAYLAIADLFSQTPTVRAVSSVVMIRRDPALAEVWNADVTGTTDGDFKIFDDGLEIATFPALSDTEDGIRDGLIAAAIAGYTAAISTLLAIKWQADVDGSTDGVFTLLDGATTVSTFTASTSTPTEIKDGLIANVVAGYTAATVDTDSLTVSKDSGVPFLLTQTSPTGNTELSVTTIGALTVTNDALGIPMTISQTSPLTNTELAVTLNTSAVGIYDDLDAAYPLSPFWGVLAPAATDPENDEGRRWVQADIATRRCFFFGESADAGIWDPGDLDNLAVAWFAAQYNRVNLMSHTVAGDYIQSSGIGVLGGIFPGSRAHHYFEITGHTTTAGISPRTTTATSTMIARRVSYTERNLGPASGLKILHGAVPKSGEFVYHRWAEDWTWYTLRVVVDGVMKSAGGVNLDEAGLQGLADAVKVALVPLVDNAVIAADYTVSFVPLAQVPAGELAIGNYKTTGAILVAFTATPKLRALRVSVAIALV